LTSSCNVYTAEKAPAFDFDYYEAKFLRATW